MVYLVIAICLVVYTYGWYTLGYRLGQSRAIKAVNAAMQVLSRETGISMQIYGNYDKALQEEPKQEDTALKSKKVSKKNTIH